MNANFETKLMQLLD
ncbi:Protein of unknown function [Lactobacillus helveticus CIRM-BIA 101]|nr:Protein of unknown function [Lactobacillus helveticus CIRM-BIA 101]